MRSSRRAALIVGVMMASGTVARPYRVRATDAVRPVEPVRADLWRLADGRELRLASIVVPDRPDTLPPTALAMVRPFADGRLLQLVGAQRGDRYGRLLGTLVDRDGDEPRLRLLRGGLAIVRFGDEPSSDLSLLMNAERIGRAAGKGVWGDLDQASVAADRVDQRVGRFALVEGRPVSIDVRSDWTYLDFGKDWKTSFAIRIAKRDVKRFVAAGLDPETLVGRLVRARGWPFASSGPMLQLKDPQELELVQ